MSDNEVTDAQVSTSPSFSQEKTLGRVKWFNNKVGYGFITTCDDEAMDVFVHHSNVHVSEQQYKYLVEGEYVHFTLTTSTNSEHKHLATEVSGINGGKLMCETRNMQQASRDSNEDAEEGSHRRGRGRGNHALRTYNPQQWKLVRRESRGASRQNTSNDVAEEV